MPRTWVIAAVGVLAIAALLLWQTRRSAPPVTSPAAVPRAERSAEEPREPGSRSNRTSSSSTGAAFEGSDDAEPPPVAAQPHWLIATFAPRPGEHMLDYRDRVVPLAQAVVEPQRRRVARARSAFEAEAQLDERQRRVLDEAVDAAVDEIKDRTMQGLLSGELLPPRVKPSDGVAFARDVLDSIDRAHQRFLAGLTERQRELLAQSRFDVAEYLLLSTRWEEMLGVTH